MIHSFAYVHIVSYWMLLNNREVLIIFGVFSVIFIDALAGLAGLEALQGMFGTRRGQQPCVQFIACTVSYFFFHRNSLIRKQVRSSELEPI